MGCIYLSHMVKDVQCHISFWVQLNLPGQRGISLLSHRGSRAQGRITGTSSYKAQPSLPRRKVHPSINHHQLLGMGRHSEDQSRYPDNTQLALPHRQSPELVGRLCFDGPSPFGSDTLQVESRKTFLMHKQKSDAELKFFTERICAIKKSPLFDYTNTQLPAERE